MPGRRLCIVRYQLGRDRERGGALVEFAMILPLALIFLIGIVQFGIVMFEYHATEFAAKYAARYASVRGAQCAANKTAGCPLTATALATAVRNAVPGLAPLASISPVWSAPSSTTYAAAGGFNPTCSSSSQEQYCVVTVKVTNPVGIDIPFVHIGKGANKDKMTFTAYGQEFVTQ